MGSRDASRKAFALGLIEQGDIWMDMIASRNRSSHTYNQATAKQIADAIVDSYHANFVALEQRLLELKRAIELAIA